MKAKNHLAMVVFSVVTYLSFHQLLLVFLPKVFNGVIMPSNPLEFYTTCCLKKITCFSDCKGVTAEGYWWHYCCGFH
jgi:hypothetical protein